MNLQNIDLKKMKYMISAFWLCIASSILPTFLQNKISNLCIIERTLITILAFLCFFGKWMNGLKNIAIVICVALSTILSFHIFAILHVIDPKLIELAQFNWFKKANCACDQVSLILVSFLFVSVITIAYLIRLSKRK